jgi:hypothetical protein
MDALIVGIIQIIGVYIACSQGISIVCRLFAKNDIQTAQINWFTLGIVLIVFWNLFEV